MSFSNFHHAAASRASSERGNGGALSAQADAGSGGAPARVNAANPSPSPVLRLCALVSQVARSRRQS